MRKQEQQQSEEEENGGGGEGLFYYLGGSAPSFLKYIQQELSRPEAKDEGVKHEKIEDLVAQKVGR